MSPSYLGDVERARSEIELRSHGLCVDDAVMVGKRLFIGHRSMGLVKKEEIFIMMGEASDILSMVV